MRASSVCTRAGNPAPLPLGAALGRGLLLEPRAHPPAAPRYCMEGKRTFSSRLILEKHVQVRHGLPLGAQSPGRGSIVVRGSGARAQVGAGPPLRLGRGRGHWDDGRPTLRTLCPRGRD